MLQEYFSLGISEDGLDETLPMLLRDYTPNLDKLPLFLMRLGPQVRKARLLIIHSSGSWQVDWTAERECFNTFLRELALFYVPEPLMNGCPGEGDVAKQSTDQGAEERAANAHRAMLWQIQHILFPAMARYLVPPKTLLDRDVVQVADLPELYRVFERC